MGWQTHLLGDKGTEHAAGIVAGAKDSRDDSDVRAMQIDDSHQIERRTSKACACSSG